MEGNLSIAEAKSAVSFSEVEAEGSAADEENPAKAESDAAWSVSSARRRALITGSTMASIAWLGLCSFAIYWGIESGQIASVTLSALAMFVSALFAPLCLIWIITLVLQRSDPLLERRLAIARTLQASIAPVDAAEAKLDRMLVRLKRDIGTVDQTVELASERINVLEDRFTKQVSNLFSATTDAEAKSAAITEQLRREHQSVDGLVRVLDDHLAEIRSTIASATDQTLQSEIESRQAFEEAAHRFETQYKALLGASEKTTKGLNAVMDSLAERTNALDAAALNAAAKLGKGVAALKAHEDQYRGFIDRFIGGFTTFDTAIDDRLNILETAQNRLDSVGDQTAKRLEDLGAETQKTVEEALSQTAAAAEQLNTHQGNVGRFNADALRALEESQHTYSAQLSAFKDETAALSREATTHIAAAQTAQDNAAKNLFQAVQRHMDQWSVELENFNLKISENSAQAGSALAAEIEMARARILESLERVNIASQAQITSLESTITQHNTAFEAAITQYQSTFDGQTARLDDQIASVSAVQGTIGQSVSAAREDLSSLQSSLESGMTALGQVAKNSAHDLLEHITDISQQAQSLLGMPEAVTQSWTEALNKARLDADAIQRASAAEFDKIRGSADDMQAATKTISHTISQSLEELNAVTERLDYGLSISENKLGDIRGLIETVDDAASRAQENLDVFKDSYAQLRSGFAEAATQDFEALEATKTEIENTVATFEAMATSLREKAGQSNDAILADYRAMLEDAATLSEKTDTAVRDVSQKITMSANKAMDLAKLKWAEFSADKQAQTLKQFDGLASALKATLDSTAQDITARMETLETQSRASLTRVSDSAREATLQNKETMDQVADLTRRIEQHTTSDLIRASSLIVDALHSLSIDIDKSLNTHLSDDDWQKYLSGDKSRFTRRSVQALSRADNRALRKRLKDDPDLKETVYNYLKDFEALMAQAMRGKEPTSLSVALISSNVGKLYVALSQAVRRFN